MNAVEDLPCGVLSFDDRLRILDANAFAARVLGYSVDALRRMSMTDLLGRAGVIFLNTHITPSLVMHAHIDEVYLDFQTRDGDKIPVLVNGVRAVVGTESRIALTFLPMHRRRLFEHELIAARDAAVEAAHAEREARSKMVTAQAQLASRERLASLGTLAHGIAHEINNPLTVIAADLESLADDLRVGTRLEPAHILELVLEARDAAKRIGDITRQMASLTRADELPRGPLDVREVVKLVERMTKVHSRTRAKVTLALGPAPTVEADSGRLGQVLINLIVNAVQAFGERPARENEIRITTRTETDGMAIIEVSDNGPGIAPEVASRIFEPFFTTKPVGEGTGLGLSISQGLVASLDGVLTCETAVGVGTTFRIALPPLKPADVPAPTPQRPKFRVLVVDDDSSVAHVIARVLRPYDVTVASSADEALAHLEADPHIHLIFSDLRMPNKDGLRFYEALEKSYPALAKRTAFISGAFGDATYAEARRRGLPVLDKPVNVRDLLEFCSERMPDGVEV